MAQIIAPTAALRLDSYIELNVISNHVQFAVGSGSLVIALATIRRSPLGLASGLKGLSRRRNFEEFRLTWNTEDGKVWMRKVDLMTQSEEWRR